jgi:hypothetical protein
MMDKQEGRKRKVGEKREGPKRIMERKDMAKKLFNVEREKFEGGGGMTTGCTNERNWKAIRNKERKKIKI